MSFGNAPVGSLGPPNVFGPAEGATGVDPWPAILTWEPGADATSYVVELSASQQDLTAGGPPGSRSD